MLLATYSCLLDQAWHKVFPQARTLQRAIRHALVWPSAMGRRTISQIICAIEVFTPKDVLESRHARELSCKIWLGHKRRRIRYKLVDSVLWRRGGGTPKLRLIVIAPSDGSDDPSPHEPGRVSESHFQA